MTIAAPEPQMIACFCCFAVQRARGERDHHGVVPREDDVHADDLEQRGPEEGIVEGHGGGISFGTSL
jgi:hypothetical protein